MSITHSQYNPGNRKPLRWAALSLLLCTATAAFLAGCGGGGSNGNSGPIGVTTTGSPGVTTGTPGTTTGTPGTTGSPGVVDASITGRIVDTGGNGVPGASVIADTGGTASTSLSQGGYRLDVTSGVVHRITASATRSGVVYSGSTQVLPFSNSLSSNVNIILSATNRQASVSGVVKDITGQPLSGARVFVALTSTLSGTHDSSLVGYADANGNYAVSSIPVDLTAGASITLSASRAGYQNVTQTLTNVGAGGAYNQTLTLTPATNAPIQPPTLTAAFTSTEPTSVLTSSARAAHAAGQGSAYDTLRRLLSPGYAALANKRGAHGTRRTAHATGNYAVETDLEFTQSSLTASSVLAYSVYRTVGGTVPTAVSTAFYDQVADPLANYYTDLTFSNFTTNTLSGVRYNFALSAVSTGTAGSIESVLSAPLSVTPLGPLTLTAPTARQSGVNPVAVSWSSVTGVTSYHAYLYTEFPTINTTPQDLGAIPATTTGFALPALTVGQQYYIVIVGISDQAETTGSTTLTTGAALTFSPITPFTVTK